MKQLLGIYQAPAPHWVGDGFPVRTLFSYDRLGKVLSPFLLLDYAGPAEFAPGAQRRGVGEHPHRGFETVTLVYSGEHYVIDALVGWAYVGIAFLTAGAAERCDARPDRVRRPAGIEHVHAAREGRVEHDVGGREQFVELGCVGAEHTDVLACVPCPGDVPVQGIALGRDDPDDRCPEVPEDARRPRPRIVGEVEHAQTNE